MESLTIEDLRLIRRALNNRVDALSTKLKESDSEELSEELESMLCDTLKTKRKVVKMIYDSHKLLREVKTVC